MGTDNATMLEKRCNDAKRARHSLTQTLKGFDLQISCDLNSLPVRNKIGKHVFKPAAASAKMGVNTGETRDDMKRITFTTETSLFDVQVKILAPISN